MAAMRSSTKASMAASTLSSASPAGSRVVVAAPRRDPRHRRPRWPRCAPRRRPPWRPRCCPPASPAGSRVAAAGPRHRRRPGRRPGRLAAGRHLVGIHATGGLDGRDALLDEGLHGGLDAVLQPARRVVGWWRRLLEAGHAWLAGRRRRGSSKQGMPGSQGGGGGGSSKQGFSARPASSAVATITGSDTPESP